MATIEDEKRKRTQEFVKRIEIAIDKYGLENGLKTLSNQATTRWTEWISRNKDTLNLKGKPRVERGYHALLGYLKSGSVDWRPSDYKLIENSDRKLVYRFDGYCPILEACKILNLQTGKVCLMLSTMPAQAMLSCVDNGLKIRKSKVRPKREYCEEEITLIKSTGEEIEEKR